MSVNMFFCCDQCDNLDHLRATEISNGVMLCFRCQRGEWHGLFEERKYCPETDKVINRPNNGLHMEEPSFG